MPGYHLCSLNCLFSNLKLYHFPPVCDPPGAPAVASEAPPSIYSLQQPKPSPDFPVLTRELSLNHLQGSFSTQISNADFAALIHRIESGFPKEKQLRKMIKYTDRIDWSDHEQGSAR